MTSTELTTMMKKLCDLIEEGMINIEEVTTIVKSCRECIIQHQAKIELEIFEHMSDELRASMLLSFMACTWQYIAESLKSGNYVLVPRANMN